MEHSHIKWETLKEFRTLPVALVEIDRLKTQIQKIINVGNNLVEAMNSSSDSNWDNLIDYWKDLTDG